MGVGSRTDFVTILGDCKRQNIQFDGAITVLGHCCRCCYDHLLDIKRMQSSSDTGNREVARCEMSGALLGVINRCGEVSCFAPCLDWVPLTQGKATREKVTSYFLYLKLHIIKPKNWYLEMPKESVKNVSFGNNFPSFVSF